MFTAIITGLTANIAYHIGYHHDIKKGIETAMLDDSGFTSNDSVDVQSNNDKSFYDWSKDTDFKKSLHERKSA